MIEMSGVLSEGRDGGYIIKAPDTPIILIDKNHFPSKQYLNAFGRQLLGKRVDVVIVEERERFYLAQISPEELHRKGFSRVRERG